MALVSWTEGALSDLDNACVFIARDSPTVAALFAQRVFRATDRPKDFPRSGRVVPELGQDEIREVLVQNYRIIYRLKSDEAEILTVHHGARSLDENLSA